MNRRRFVQGSLAVGVATLARSPAAGDGRPSSVPSVAWPPRADAPPAYGRLLVLIELKGGNDGLNTVIPYREPAYAALRPTLAIARDAVVPLDDRTALHPSLAPLASTFAAGRLAIVQGVGYPAPNLSHFRSIEIWDTASASDRHLADGWLARTFAAAPAPAESAADGVVIGSNDMGPFAGSGARALALADTEQFLRRARLARAEPASRNHALAHIQRVEGDVVRAATRLDATRAFATGFPATPFGNAVRTACHLAASPAGIACLRLTQNGYDTHTGQAGTHARLLRELAEGLVALEQGLTELGRWNDTLAMTYAEFGRRPHENASGGTDHGTASTHFVLGGRVAGGLYGAPPALARLGSDGNLAHAVDFRSLYATALERWWGVASAPVLGGRFTVLPLLRA
jgi:uncharacterized protein (DUF1501 family)